MSDWKLQFLSAGFCQSPMALAMQGCTWQRGQFPSLVGVLTHPTYGVVLFDTGYSQHYLAAARKWPNRLSGLIAPVTCPSADDAKHQLGRRGINPKDVRCIVISHFHADHIAGLKDFPYARYLFTLPAWQAVQGKTGMAALTQGYMPSLLPNDFEERASPLLDSAEESLPPQLSPFVHGWPLLPRTPIWIVSLPGHSIGHVGLVVSRDDGFDFLVGDAVYTRQALAEMLLPPRITQQFFGDRGDYLTTIHQLRELRAKNPSVRILPSHCLDTASEVSAVAIDEGNRPKT